MYMLAVRECIIIHVAGSALLEIQHSRGTQSSSRVDIFGEQKPLSNAGASSFLLRRWHINWRSVINRRFWLICESISRCRVPHHATEKCTLVNSVLSDLLAATMFLRYFWQCGYFWECTTFKDSLLSEFHHLENFQCELFGNHNLFLFLVLVFFFFRDLPPVAICSRFQSPSIDWTEPKSSEYQGSHSQSSAGSGYTLHHAMANILFEKLAKKKL